MKKAKAAVKKLKKVQDKIRSIEGKAKAISRFVEHPGASFGGAIGAKLGSRKVGTAVGGFLGRVTGLGDYSVNSTINGSRVLADAVPTFQKTSGGVIFTHREYLGEVIASSSAGAFSNTSYAVNPGLFSTFPWFASIANQFDEWEPLGIVFVYKSMSSVYSGTTQLGTVIMASDYDVSDTAYTSKIEMENSQFAVSCNTACSIVHGLECKPSERLTKLYFTRSGAVPTTDNARWYDLCNFQVATQGCVANQVCGELWVTYKIRLYKPQLYGGNLGRGILYSLNTLGASTGSNWFAAQSVTADSTIRDITASTNTITFPEVYAGCYWLVQVNFIGDSTACTASTATVTGGMQIKNADQGLTNQTTATSTVFIKNTYLRQVASPGVASTLVFSSNTIPANITTSILRITQINPNECTS
jgi:hypothetical protein